jgi:hypothetical protein
MKCPGSVALCEDIPSTSSVFADEGTAAHMLAERCLKNGRDPASFLGEIIVITPNVNFVVTDTMVEAVQLYIDTVGEVARGPRVLDVEYAISLSWIPGLEDGTVDAAVDPRDIIDLKYGAGVPVEVADNPQLKLYALGAFGLGRAVRTTIVQPRCPHPEGSVRSIEYTAMELMDFALEVADAAWATLQPNAPLVPGDQCRFCPARAVCPALRAEIMAAGDEIFGGLVTVDEPTALSPERLADLLGKARLLKTWMKAIEVHAHAEALAGRAPPGFKLVASRAMRKWSASPDDVLAAVSEFGLTSDDVYETSLVSPAQMDKLLKKNKKAIVPFVTKVSGGTILVDESDPRPCARLTGSEAFQIEDGDNDDGS